MKNTRDYAEEFEDRTRGAIEDARSMASKTGFYRSAENRMLGGVCGGIAEKLDIDPSLVRILTVVAVIFAGVGVWVYLLLWALLPINAGRDELDLSFDELPPIPHSGPYVDVPGMDPVDGPSLRQRGKATPPIQEEDTGDDGDFPKPDATL